MLDSVCTDINKLSVDYTGECDYNSQGFVDGIFYFFILLTDFFL